MLSRAIFFSIVVAVACGQAPAPNFEVASVKPSGPAPPAPAGGRGGGASPIISGGPGTADPERLNYSRVPLRNLLFRAYGVQPDQISAPGWLESELFDITAKVPPGTTKEQANAMLQNLLVERFKITLHHQSKDFPAYELSVARSGSKLKEATPVPNGVPIDGPNPGGLPKMEVDANGFVVMPAGRISIMATRGNGLNRMTCRSCSIAELIQQISIRLAVVDETAITPGRVVDKSGLSGKYDFTLEFGGGMIGGALQSPALGSQAEPGPDLFVGLEKQLGLKLEKTKAPVDVLVIDHIERVPTEN